MSAIYTFSRNVLLKNFTFGLTASPTSVYFTHCSTFFGPLTFLSQFPKKCLRLAHLVCNGPTQVFVLLCSKFGVFLLYDYIWVISSFFYIFIFFQIDPHGYFSGTLLCYSIDALSLFMDSEMISTI